MQEYFGKNYSIMQIIKNVCLATRSKCPAWQRSVLFGASALVYQANKIDVFGNDVTTTLKAEGQSGEIDKLNHL